MEKTGAGHVLGDGLRSDHTALQRSSTHPGYQTMSDRGRSMRAAQTHKSSPRDARALEGALVVPLEFIERDPGQPRRDWRTDWVFDPKQDTYKRENVQYARLEELAESIRTVGILQPLV